MTTLASLMPDHVSADEKAMAVKLIERILKDDGNVISINDGEEWTVYRSRDAETIVAALATTDHDIVAVRDGDGEKLGSFVLIWGNSGEELISDHTANDYCESIWMNVVDP